MAPFPHAVISSVPLPSVPLSSALPSTPPAHINLALNALSFFTKVSSQREFCRLGGVDPFNSIHSIHLFVRWLASLPVRQFLSSDLLLVAWAIRGFPAGLRTFLQWSLARENVPEERINLEYLLWHLEMWRSVFSSMEVVEKAREKGKSPSIHIAEWYANAPGDDRKVALDAAQRYWNRFSGNTGLYFYRSSCSTAYPGLLPVFWPWLRLISPSRRTNAFRVAPESAAGMYPGGTKALKPFSTG